MFGITSLLLVSFRSVENQITNGNNFVIYFAKIHGRNVTLFNKIEHMLYITFTKLLQKLFPSAFPANCLVFVQCY